MSIDIQFENIIVRELYPQVFLQVFSRQADRAADIDVAVLRSPVMPAVGVFLYRAPSSILRRPSAVVE